MNIIVVLVTFGCTAFLFRFLMALAKEQKKPPRLLRAHWLDLSDEDLASIIVYVRSLEPVRPPQFQ